MSWTSEQYLVSRTNRGLASLYLGATILAPQYVRPLRVHVEGRHHYSSVWRDLVTAARINFATSMIVTGVKARSATTPQWLSEATCVTSNIGCRNGTVTTTS